MLGYKLKSNNRIAIIRKIMTYSLIVTLVLSFCISLSGCCIIGAGEASSSNGKINITGNKLMANDKKNKTIYVTEVDDNGKETVAEMDSSFTTASVNTTKYYGFDARKHWTKTRDLAIMIHNSIFQTQYDPAGDYFADPDGLTTFNLTPAALIQSVNETTINAMNNNNGAFSTIADALKGLSAAILISMWAMGFISQIVNEKFTMETLLKTLMQLLCGILLIVNSTVIVSAFSSAGNAFIKVLNPDATLAFTEFERTIREEYLTKGVYAISIGFNIKVATICFFTICLDFGSLIAIVLMAIPLIAEVLCAYKIVSILVMRMLELVIRITFAPIPIAFAAQNGFSQEAIRYFRSVLACAIQPALMIVGCLFVNTIGEVIAQIFSNSDVNSLSNLLAPLAMGMSYFILSAFIGSTKHLAQEVIAR